MMAALTLATLMARPATGFGQSVAASDAKAAAVLKSREGADVGAQPCKYDSLPRPSVLVTPARLALVRQEVLHGHGGPRDVFEKDIKANADRWLQRTIVIPGVGGWAHDFFCTDGTMLELPKDQRFDPNVPSRCPVCGKTYSGPKIAGARRFFEHYWLSGAARDLALTYAIEQKPEYARKAAEILIKYADAFPRELGDGGYQENTLTEAVSIIPLAEAYDLVCNPMTPEERSHVERDFFWPAAQSLTHAGFKGNWGSWHLSAIGVIGYATRHQRFIDFATAQFKSQIADQLGDDGLWPESVGTYHFYALDAFSAFAEAAANCGDDLFKWEARPGKGLKAMYEAPLYYAYPNLRLAEINDGWFECWLPRDQYTLAYQRYHLPEFAWAIRQLQREGKSGNSGEFMDRHYRYLLYGEPLPAKIPKPVFTSTNFPVLGIAVLRQDFGGRPQGLPADKEMMMTFHYGPFLGHGHFDKMGVTLFANGRILVPDYGTSGYGIALSRFLQSAPGHNTIVVDGKNQPRTRDRNLVAFADTPHFKLAAARTSELAPGTTWTRTVMLADRYAVIWDKISGKTVHRYDWMLHAEGKAFSLNNAAETPAATNQFPYPFITGVKHYTLDGTPLARWDSGDRGLDLWLLEPPGQTAFAGQFPTPEIRRVPELVLRQKSDSVEFLAVLRPWQGREKPGSYPVQFRREADGSVQVTISFGGREDRLHLGQTVDYECGDAKPISINLTGPLAN